MIQFGKAEQEICQSFLELYLVHMISFAVEKNLIILWIYIHDTILNNKLNLFSQLK